MNKKSIIFLIVAIVFFIVAICIFVYANSIVSSDNKDVVVESEIVEEEEEPFTFYDDNGNEFSLENFDGAPTTLILWSSDTENSFEIIELIEEVYNDYKNNVNFLIINTEEPDENIMEVIEACNYSFEVYYDLDNKASEYYSYSLLPTMIFMEANGEISNQIESSITEDSLLANLDLISENY